MKLLPRLLLLLLALSLLVVPGCSLLNLPFRLAQTVVHTLFFWTSALPRTAPLPTNPITIERAATLLATRTPPEGPVWVLPPGGHPPAPALVRPSPGAVPVVMEIRGAASPDVVARLLAAQGIESR